MDRDYWARHIAGLDAQAEYEQIYRILVSHEFPWDMNQSLSFALYRTYAVPSIGRLLKQTGEFTERTQKRYDDTALILDTVLEHGMGSEPGRAAIRRMNQMHGAYPICNDDKLYVLCTFVTMPIRWLDAYGRVHGLDNVYAADGSVFVTSGAHNPTNTIMAVALRNMRQLGGS